MSERPRRSTRNSSYNSPAHTPGPAAGGGGGGALLTPGSHLVYHGIPSATPVTPMAAQYHPSTPSAQPSCLTRGGGGGSSSSSMQTAAAQHSQTYQTFQPSHLQHPHDISALQQPQMHQPAMHHLPNAWTISKHAAPVPPFTPLAPPHHAVFPSTSSHGVRPIPQALYTTFPSRMRVGVTTLMQPIHPTDLFDPLGRPLDPLATPLHESRADYGIASGSASFARSSHRASKRRAAAGYIRYAEADDSGEDFDDDLAATEDEAAGAAGVRSHKRKPNGVGTPDDGAGDDEGEQEEEEGLRSYLGLPPPGNKVIARRMFRPSAHLYHAEEDVHKQASRNEVLVPIRIELETETHRIKDTFTWNMNERLVTPQHFARLLLEDLDLPLEPYAKQISNMIAQQVKEAIGVADIEMEPAAGGIWSAARLEAKKGELALTDEEKAQYDPAEENVKEARQWDWGLARLDPEQKEWRHRMAKRLKTGEALGTEEDDMRVIVDYEVQILRHSLRDRLEWDLCSPLTPESFAAQLCKDLGLTGEALSLISNSVREQLINHRRAALDLGLLGSGKLLKEKQAEIVQATEEVMRGKAERARRRLEGTATGTETPRSEAEGEQEAEAEAEGEIAETPRAGGAEQVKEMATPTETDGQATLAFAGQGDGSDSETDEVETLHLTAPATAAGTAAPTREPSAVPAATPAGTTTRTSSRLAAAAATTSSNAVSIVEPKQSAAQRLTSATYIIRDITARGPRELEGVWRDFAESREFGPLLERLTDEDLQKAEEANVRASRRVSDLCDVPVRLIRESTVVDF